MATRRLYAPGLYGLVGGIVNVYVLEHEAGVTVIDAGMPGLTRRILRLIRDIGHTPPDIKQILITHADVDHVGSLRPLADATGATVYASAETSRYIQRRRNPPHVKMPMVFFAEIVSFLFRRSAAVGHLVQDGDRLDIAGGIQVIGTPGHTSDHMCYFWQAERVLFAGDLFNNIHGLALTPHRITFNMEAAFESVRRVLELNPAVICPGHGRVWLADNDPGRIAALLAAVQGKS